MEISIDLMSGDVGLSSNLYASVQAINTFKDLNLIFVGDKNKILKNLKDIVKNSSLDVDKSKFEIVHSDDIVLMTDNPINALKNRKESSMRKSIDLVKSGEAQAIVSSGNTGALMAMSHFVIKTIDGIERSAIISRIPTNKGICRALDLGANIESSPKNLAQFATMANILTKSLDNKKSPKVGLLNIGTEEMKGNSLVKETNVLLKKDNKLNYIGYIEPDKILCGIADIVVCDGFTGNIALKSIEGSCKFISSIISNSFKKNIFTKMLGLLTKNILSNSLKFVEPYLYNGATLIGLNEIVIKSHGAACSKGFLNAIKESRQEVINNVPLLIKQKFNK